MSIIDSVQNPILASQERDSEREQSFRSQVPQRWCDRFAVTIVFVVFVVFRAADRAFLYRVQKYLKQPSYNLILSNIIWPISIQLMTVIMLLGYIIMLRQQGHTEYSWRFFLPGNVLASTAGAVPLFRLALFSLGDQVNAAMSAPPSPFITLPLQSIMTNFVLVWMLGIASVWLRTSFKQVHYIGCSLIVLAVVVGVADKIESDDCTMSVTNGTLIHPKLCLTAYKTATGAYATLTFGSLVLWYGLFVLSTVPAAMSNCYKQKVLKGVDLDVVYATFWSGNFQVIWGLMLFWINWIPLPNQEVTKPSQTFQAIADTWQCFLGNVPHPPEDDGCAQEGGPALKWFLVYLFFNLSFNVCFLWLVKRMSAVWAQIATTLCLALTNIFSQFSFLVGDSASIMTLSQWLATILASIALWTYNLEAEIIPGEGADVARQARSFLPSLMSDGNTGLLESATQKTTDTPVKYLKKAADTPVSFLTGSITNQQAEPILLASATY